MKIHEVVYNVHWMPSPGDAVEVLAYLLMHERVIAHDSLEAELPFVRRVLHRAKRDLLIDWYAEHTRRGG